MIKAGVIRMDSTERNTERSRSGLGDLLRDWRRIRGKSQFDLALDAGVSQRHVSFVESGRSVPSRQVLMRIADALDVPLRDRNALLTAAGYAALYADTGLDAPEMDSITRALRRVLQQHEPFPAVVLDRYWNVILTNEAAPKFFGQFVDIAARPAPRNLLHLMFDPDGMRPFIADWEATSDSLLARVRRETIGHTIDRETADLIAALLDYSLETPARPSRPAAQAPWSPVVPIGFVRADCTLRYFSMITTVGTPQTVAAQELRIECMYPADMETERRHLALMEGGEHA